MFEESEFFGLSGEQERRKKVMQIVAEKMKYLVIINELKIKIGL